ncbi:hypothetical protein CANARDRAFT_184813, partial [[Candida] arabinofermentans NRRL YB-2248]
KLLNKQALSYEYSNSIPLYIWLRTAGRILKHAKWYLADNVLDEAYILYCRLMDLIIDKLYRHPDLKKLKAEYSITPLSKNVKVYDEFLKLRAALPNLMSEAEKIKQVLTENYSRYLESEKRKKQLIELQELKFQQLKAQEQERIEGFKKKQENKSDQNNVDEANLSKKLRSLSNNSLSSFETLNNSNIPSYPNLPVFDQSYTQQQNQSLPSSPPPIYQQLPQLPKKPSTKTGTSSKKETVHKTVNFTEGGSPLRTIFISPNLIDSFLKLAKRNTSKKLETCGILCGKLNRNAFFITYLIIPDQDSTANTCNTKNEEKLFDVIDNLDLFILGWIHTHPTQSCFLSSVDLHTQNSYQIMLNEAIAIVCSPSEKFDKKLGVFRLTDPPGIPKITNCNLTGFHPHPENDLYVECNRLNHDNPASGHVVIKGELPFEVKDLR